MVDVIDTTYEVSVDDTTYNVAVTVASISGTLNNISDVVITSPVNGQGLSYNATSGVWENATGTGSGDMTKAVYDPTSVSGDAFDMDNMVQGSTNFFISSSDVTNLSNLSGTNTGDQDLSSYAFTSTLTAHTGDSTIHYASSSISIPHTQISDWNAETSSFLTSYTETDPVFVAAPAYNIASSDISAWDAKQDALVAGTDYQTPLVADSDYLVPSTATATYEPLKGADDNFVTDAQLTNITNLDTAAYTSSTAYAAALGVNDNYVTDAEKTNIGNLNTAAYQASTVFASASHTQAASTITDFDTEVSNNTDVAANTSARHLAVTVSGTPDYITLSGQDLVRGQIDLTSDVTGFLPIGNVVTNTGASSTTFLRGDGSWATPSGSGDVSKVGTPVDNQVGVWTGNGTIEGTSGLTYNGTALDITGNITISGTVDTVDIQSLASSVSTNNSKVSNATHTGDVTGDTVLTIANDAVDIAMLSATGTASSTTYLRGDNTWSTLPTRLSNVVEDTTPQLGGNLDWNSNGMTLVGQTVGGSDGNLVYLSGANTWTAADADAAASCSGMLGIRVSSTVVLTNGLYTTSGLTAGSIYYASTTAGGITTTAPSATGDIVRIIGYALSTTELFFDPDKTFIELS